MERWLEKLENASPRSGAGAASTGSVFCTLRDSTSGYYGSVALPYTSSRGPRPPAGVRSDTPAVILEVRTLQRHGTPLGLLVAFAIAAACSGAVPGGSSGDPGGSTGGAGGGTGGGGARDAASASGSGGAPGSGGGQGS